MSQSQGGLSAGHGYLCSSYVEQAPKRQAGFALNESLNLLTDFQPCHWSYMKGFWQGRNSPPRQFVVNPWGWPLALLSVLWLCWLPSQCLHPSACLREELLKFIAALTHQLETCQAAYIFTTIVWALIPEGALRQGSTVTDSTTQLLSDVLGSIWGAGQDALVLAQLLQTASV